MTDNFPPDFTVRDALRAPSRPMARAADVAGANRTYVLATSADWSDVVETFPSEGRLLEQVAEYFLAEVEAEDGETWPDRGTQEWWGLVSEQYAAGCWQFLQAGWIDHETHAWHELTANDA